MFYFISLMYDTFTLNSDIMTPFFTVHKIKNQRDNQSSDDPNGTRAHISTPQLTVLYAKAVGVDNSIV